MTPQNAEKGSYTYLRDFREEWESLYRCWDPKQTVWVVEFDYAGADRNL